MARLLVGLLRFARLIGQVGQVMELLSAQRTASQESWHATQPMVLDREECGA